MGEITSGHGSNVNTGEVVFCHLQQSGVVEGSVPPLGFAGVHFEPVHGHTDLSGLEPGEFLLAEVFEKSIAPKPQFADGGCGRNVFRDRHGFSQKANHDPLEHFLIDKVDFGKTDHQRHQL